MSYSLSSYTVKFDELKLFIGSKNQEMLKKLANIIDEPEELEAARTLINGDMMSTDYSEAPYYGYALMHICSIIGESLPNGEFVSIGYSWFLDSCPEVLQELINNEPPIDIPFIEEFPQIGFKTIEKLQLELSQKEVILNEISDSDVKPCVESYFEWVNKAVSENKILVGFFY